MGGGNRAPLRAASGAGSVAGGQAAAGCVMAQTGFTVRAHLAADDPTVGAERRDDDPTPQKAPNEHEIARKITQNERDITQDNDATQATFVD